MFIKGFCPIRQVTNKPIKGRLGLDLTLGVIITMNDLLLHALQVVANERGAKFDKAFAAATALVSGLSESDLAERIVAEAPPSVPWEVIADLLGILQWSTKDNGAAICRTAERWLLEGSDVRRMSIALDLDSYPFLDDEQMQTVLERIAQQFPELAFRCRALIAERTKGVAK